MKPKKPTIPVRLNILLASILIITTAVQLVVLPLCLLPMSPAWGWLLAPIALMSTTYWALAHECFHGAFHPKTFVNDGAGRLLCVFLGSPFRILRVGHLMHHRFNRSELDRTEVTGDEDAASGNWFGPAVIYYARLLGGLYLVEFLASAAALLPKRSVSFLVFAAFGAEASDGRTMYHAARQQLLERSSFQQIRFDGLLVCLLYGGAFWLFGEHFWMLALAILARAFLISFFDNSYHYGTPLGDVLSSRNLKLPRPLAFAILNFNLHGVHHREPAVPWSGLPGRFDERGDQYEGGYLSVAFRQMRGPIPQACLEDRSTASQRSIRAIKV